jgi:hypothetical protein
MVMVMEIAALLGIGHHTIQKMTQTLGYFKVCSHWVHIKIHMGSSQSDVKGDYFLSKS